MNTPASASLTSAAISRPLHILYAADLRELRELIGCGLTREGHHIETVGDGGEALKRLTPALAAFDLLITDHQMPGLNGLELVRHIRQLPFSGKIIIFSSELSQAVQEQYRQLAVDLILPKLIFPVTLHRMLEQLFAPGSAEPWRREVPAQTVAAHG